MGKSALMLFMAHQSALQVPTLVFSLEMPGEENATRAIAMQSAIGNIGTTSVLNYQDIDNNNLCLTQYEIMKEHAASIKNIQLRICDDANMTVQKIRRICKSIKSKYGLGAVYIDYLQLLAHEDRHKGMYAQVTENSGALKRLQRELDVPMVVLSQLSRGVEQREDRRPFMSDLKESGAIEQDADVIIFPFRKAYYLEREESPEAQVELIDAANSIEIIVAKQRSGPTGSFVAGCNIGANAFWTKGGRR